VPRQAQAQVQRLPESTPVDLVGEHVEVQRRLDGGIGGLQAQLAAAGGEIEHRLDDDPDRRAAVAAAVTRAVANEDMSSCMSFRKEEPVAV
jgi:hypothetical protein